MEIIETSIFSKQVNELLTAEDYREFQNALILNPASGPIIPGGGGLRKIRWRKEGSGKRGAVRIIYYWQVSEDIILMLYGYTKNRQENLSKDQLKRLKNYITSQYKDNKK